METVPQLHTPFFQDIFIHYLSPKYKLASQHRTALQATRGPGPLSETTFFQLVWALIDITLVCGWKSFSRCKNCTLSSSVYCQKYFKCRRDLSCLFCIIKACPHFTNIYIFFKYRLRWIQPQYDSAPVIRHHNREVFPTTEWKSGDQSRQLLCTTTVVHNLIYIYRNKPFDFKAVL